MIEFKDRNRGPKRFDRKPRRDFDRGDDFDRPRSFEKKVFSKRRDSRSRDRGEMHKVVCDKCGKDCEVPFKPSPDKPVYCDECFGKKGNSNGSGGSNNQLEEINKKLDQILKLLE